MKYGLHSIQKYHSSSGTGNAKHVHVHVLGACATVGACEDGLLKVDGILFSVVVLYRLR